MSAIFLFILLGVYTKAGAAYWICFGWYSLCQVIKIIWRYKND